MVSEKTEISSSRIVVEVDRSEWVAMKVVRFVFVIHRRGV
jgi:hypothetical protein